MVMFLAAAPIHKPVHEMILGLGVTFLLFVPCVSLLYITICAIQSAGFVACHMLTLFFWILVIAINATWLAIQITACAVGFPICVLGVIVLGTVRTLAFNICSHPRLYLALTFFSLFDHAYSYENSTSSLRGRVASEVLGNSDDNGDSGWISHLMFGIGFPACVGCALSVMSMLML